jgi:hypothetical protein
MGLLDTSIWVPGFQVPDKLRFSRGINALQDAHPENFGKRHRSFDCRFTEGIFWKGEIPDGISVERTIVRNKSPIRPDSFTSLFYNILQFENTFLTTK